MRGLLGRAVCHLALVVGLLATPVPGAAAPPTTLVVALPADPGNIDAMGSIQGATELIHHVYRRLYSFTQAMVPQPDLVAAEHVSADLRTWTLELKRNVTFFDGTPVNAAAVKYSIDRHLDPARASPRAPIFRPIKEVRVKGEHVVEIETTEPFASLKHNLAYHVSGIVSPAAERKLGPQFGRFPVSAGPYIVAEWMSGERIVLKRFEGYQGPRPYYDQLVFRIVPAPETRLAMLERGEAQVAVRMPPTMARVAAGNPDLRVLRIEGTELYYFWLNLDRPPMNDLRVRRAVNLAVDRASLMEKVALGAASPAHSVMERLIRYSCPVGTLAYDPAEARRLLREAGVVDLRLRMVAGDGVFELDRQLAEAVAGYLREVGLPTELRLVADGPALTEAMAKRDAHLGLWSWSGATADPDQYLKRQLWGPIAGQLYNLAGYRNSRVDALIERGARTFPDAERARIYCEVQGLVWQDWPWLILFRQDGATIARSEVTGIEVYVNAKASVFTRARPAGM